MDVNEMVRESLSGLAYGVVGLGLLVLGYFVLDLLTPGHLAQLIYRDRNRNAAIVLSSCLASVATVTTTAIVTSENRFVDGIVGTTVYGAIGIFLLAVSFAVVDRLTPGSLGVICTDPERHPAVYVTATAQLAVGAIVAAAIS